MIVYKEASLAQMLTARYSSPIEPRPLNFSMSFSRHSEATAPHVPRFIRSCAGMAAALFFLMSMSPASAAPSYTFNLTSNTQPPLPAWLDPIHRQDDGNGHGQLEIAIRPPTNASHLALTLIYEEKAEQKLSVTWQADGEAPYVLSENLLGTLDGVRDQKTLLIDQALIGTGGTLLIEYSSAEVVPSRIKTDWVSASPVLASNLENLPALVTSTGQTVSRQALTGGSFTADPDKAGEDTIDASLFGPAESLDDSLQIEMPLEAPVRGARISASVLGIPLNVSISAYINNVYIGELQIEMPDLDDPGYDFSESGTTYAGWRTATLTVQGSALRVGTNTITFAPSATDPHAALTDPSYIRDGRLQILYKSP